MSWRDLQHNPFVFWGLAIIAVIGFVFSFGTYWHDRPSREISYFYGTSEILDLDKYGPTELVIDGHRITQGSVYLSRLFIWNSGNQQITIDDLGNPLQWAGAPMTTKTTYHGIRKDQVEGDIRTGLRFKLLYPDTGVVLTFFTNNMPDISLTGSVSGGTGSSGLLKRDRAKLADFSSYLLGLWVFISLVTIAVIRQWGRPNDFGGYAGEIVVSIIVGLLPTFIVFVIVPVWYDYGLPPF